MLSGRASNNQHPVGFEDEEENENEDD